MFLSLDKHFSNTTCCNTISNYSEFYKLRWCIQNENKDNKLSAFNNKI